MPTRWHSRCKWTYEPRASFAKGIRTREVGRESEEGEENKGVGAERRSDLLGHQEARAKGYRAKRWREASGVKAKIHRRRGWEGRARCSSGRTYEPYLTSVDRKTPCRERESRWSTCRPCGIGLWHGSSNALDLERERGRRDGTSGDVNGKVQGRKDWDIPACRCTDPVCTMGYIINSVDHV